MLADCAKRVSFETDGRCPEISYLEVSNIGCKSPLRLVQTGRMDEIKAQEYRYWQSRPVHERTDAVSELTQAMYAMKGAAPNVPRL